MLQQHFEDFRWKRADVGTKLARLYHVSWCPDGCDQDLRLVFVVLENRDDVADQLHSIQTDIIQTSNERADEVGAGLCSKQSLGCGKDQSDIDANAFIAEHLGGFQSLSSHRALHDNVLVKFCKM